MYRAETTGVVSFLSWKPSPLLIYGGYMDDSGTLHGMRVVAKREPLTWDAVLLCIKTSSQQTHTSEARRQGLSPLDVLKRYDSRGAQLWIHFDCYQGLHQRGWPMGIFQHAYPTLQKIYAKLSTTPSIDSWNPPYVPLRHGLASEVAAHLFFCQVLVPSLTLCPREIPSAFIPILRPHVVILSDGSWTLYEEVIHHLQTKTLHLRFPTFQETGALQTMSKEDLLSYEGPDLIGLPGFLEQTKGLMSCCQRFCKHIQTYLVVERPLQIRRLSFEEWKTYQPEGWFERIRVHCPLGRPLPRSKGDHFVKGKQVYQILQIKDDGKYPCVHTAQRLRGTYRRIYVQDGTYLDIHSPTQYPSGYCTSFFHGRHIPSIFCFLSPDMTEEHIRTLEARCQTLYLIGDRGRVAPTTTTAP